MNAFYTFVGVVGAGVVSVELLALALAGLVFYLRERGGRTRHQAPAAPEPTRLDWCDGCDQIRPARDLGFTEGGLYRCDICRGQPQPKNTQRQHWERRQQSAQAEGQDWPQLFAQMQAALDKYDQENAKLRHKLALLADLQGSVPAPFPKRVTGRNIELMSVPDGSQIIARGGGASIVVHGEVGCRAELLASGGDARITIGGHVGAHSTVRAEGGGAMVRYGSADPTAHLTASGGASKVIEGKSA